MREHWRAPLVGSAHVHRLRPGSPFRLTAHRTCVVLSQHWRRHVSLRCFWEIVVTRLHGECTVTVRGPETKASEVHCPADGEWFAIRFSAGTFMPQLPVGRLLNGKDVTLPQANRRRFWLNGEKWESPDFENAESFVARLAKAKLIVRDSAVIAALRGEQHALSTRSAQRHFLRATGMTHGTMRKIERARNATNLLRQGLAIADVVHEAGYFDQAHLTRSLRELVGVTPAKIAAEERQLSFLYNTTPAQ